MIEKEVMWDDVLFWKLKIRFVFDVEKIDIVCFCFAFYIFRIRFSFLLALYFVAF